MTLKGSSWRDLERRRKQRWSGWRTAARSKEGAENFAVIDFWRRPEELDAGQTQLYCTSSSAAFILNSDWR